MLIDPSIFFPFRKGRQVDSATQALLEVRLDCLSLILNRTGARVVFTDQHWAKLYSQHIDAAFEGCSGTKVRAAITMLRRRFQSVKSPAGQVTTWGFLPLLVNAGTQAAYWSDGLALTAVPLLRNAERVMLFTGLDENRNLRTRSSGHCEVREKTRWAVYVGATGLPGATLISCVCNLRNVTIPWTTRYDEKLPDTAPTHGHAFLPVHNWIRRKVSVTCTHAGKPSWIDSGQNKWIPPNTPGHAYHWDVHFANPADSPNGLNPCNIVASECPANEGTPGGVHHVPTAKAARARA